MPLLLLLWRWVGRRRRLDGDDDVDETPEAELFVPLLLLVVGAPSST